MKIHEVRGGHLEDGQTAAYVDRRLEVADLARVEAHLAVCAECRGEVIEVRRLLRRQTRRWTWVGIAGVGIAAAMILLLVRPRGEDLSLDASHRGSQGGTVSAPAPISPTGAVMLVDTLRWLPAGHADRYRIRLFDAEGQMVFLQETSDTFAVIPDSVRLRSTARYYWKVEGRVGFDRWIASPLMEFTVAGPSP